MRARDVALERWWPWWHWYQRQLDRDAPLEMKHVQAALVSGFLAGGSFALKTSPSSPGLAPTLDLFNQLLASELLERTKQD